MGWLWRRRAHSRGVEVGHEVGCDSDSAANTCARAKKKSGVVHVLLEGLPEVDVFESFADFEVKRGGGDRRRRRRGRRRRRRDNYASARVDAQGGVGGGQLVVSRAKARHNEVSAANVCARDDKASAWRVVRHALVRSCAR